MKLLGMIVALIMIPACLVPAAHSATLQVVIGEITKIRTFPNVSGTTNYDASTPALLAIYVDGLPPGCGTGGVARAVMQSDWAMYETVLSQALTAYGLGAPVRVSYRDTCTIRGGSWDLWGIDLPGE